MAGETTGGEKLIAATQNAADIVPSVSENRNPIEVSFEGDLTHTRTVDLSAGGRRGFGVTRPAEASRKLAIHVAEQP